MPETNVDMKKKKNNIIIKTKWQKNFMKTEKLVRMIV